MRNLILFCLKPRKNYSRGYVLRTINSWTIPCLNKGNLFYFIYCLITTVPWSILAMYSGIELFILLALELFKGTVNHEITITCLLIMINHWSQILFNRFMSAKRNYVVYFYMLSTVYWSVVVKATRIYHPTKTNPLIHRISKVDIRCKHYTDWKILKESLIDFYYRFSDRLLN